MANEDIAQIFDLVNSVTDINVEEHIHRCTCPQCCELRVAAAYKLCQEKLTIERLDLLEVMRRELVVSKNR